MAELWTITTAYTVDERAIGGSWHTVAPTVRGPEQRRPIEVVPASQIQGTVAPADLHRVVYDVMTSDQQKVAAVRALVDAAIAAAGGR